MRDVRVESLGRYGRLPEVMPEGRPRMKEYEGGEESGVAKERGQESERGFEREGEG